MIAASGNTKLGAAIHSFSIPAVRTCPGRTAFCERLCYATKGRYYFPAIKERYGNNYERTLRSDFVSVIKRELRQDFVRILRVHTSGDFYDEAYIRKWIAIVRSCTATQFFAYTRSWRVPALVEPLRELGALRNFQLWWSEDRDSGPSPVTPGIRVAFLVADRDDEASIPENADLVFRDRKHLRLYKNPVKRLGQHVLVCPFENGVTTGITCTRCQICLKPPRASP